jgi:hypothetical protein
MVIEAIHRSEGKELERLLEFWEGWAVMVNEYAKVQCPRRPRRNGLETSP